MTIGACSPPWSSSVSASTLVDSASPGRKLVDSLFSASEYFPGRFAAPEPSRTRRHTASTTHLARRPAENVSKRDTGGRFLGGAGRCGDLRAYGAAGCGDRPEPRTWLRPTHRIEDDPAVPARI